MPAPYPQWRYRIQLIPTGTSLSSFHFPSSKDFVRFDWFVGQRQGTLIFSAAQCGVDAQSSPRAPRHRALSARERTFTALLESFGRRQQPDHIRFRSAMRRVGILELWVAARGRSQFVAGFFDKVFRYFRGPRVCDIQVTWNDSACT